MKAIQFPESNSTIGGEKNGQPQYYALPIYYDVDDKEGNVVYCHRLSLRERLNILIHGKLWSSQRTFRVGFHPTFHCTLKSEMFLEAKKPDTTGAIQRFFNRMSLGHAILLSLGVFIAIIIITILSRG